jgi:hypothetical protein
VVRESGSVTEVGRPAVRLETIVEAWLRALVTVIVAVEPETLRE